MDLGDLVTFFVSLVQSPLFIISIAFWAIAFILIKILGKNKEMVTLFFPFLILIRSKKLNKFFRKIARKYPKFWKVFWNIGVVVSFCLMLFALYFFVSNFIQLIFDPKPENAIMPLIPGVTIDLPTFTALIVPLLITITVHEFSHAIAAETDGVNVKSAGIMGAGIFFIIGYGAFVEVDEFQLNSKTFSSSTRLRVASAGVWSNIILAGLAFLLLSIYPSTMGLGYDTTGFQINEVVPLNEGGYNEDNVFSGDIVYSINGTVINYLEGPTLTDVLMNTTELECSVGDQLVLTCYDPESHDYYNRSIVLGVRSFIGFNYQQYNATAFQILEVYDTLLGGNNYNPELIGQIITHVNGTAINNETGSTLDLLFTNFTPNYKMILTNHLGINYTVDVNYFPGVATAHVLRNVFIGINITQIDTNSIEITTILSNGTESGINEGRIPENTIIKQINGIPLNLSQIDFKTFIEQYIDPKPGDILNFTDEYGKSYSILTSEIPVIPVYVGITSQPYWIPRNWVGRLLGPIFPNSYHEFILYIWMISLSLALFNLLPTSIFDGGRMMKEIINLLFGKDYDPQARKKLRYEFDVKSPKQHLFTHNIHKIHSCKALIPIEGITDTKEEIEFMQTDIAFHGIDTSSDDYLDTIELENTENLEPKTLIEVDVEYEQDLKENQKKITYRIISWLTGGIVIASLVISIAKFNETIFWM
ncbi:MAG: site-2 protease family protein [Promethearchaeota archaeon]